MGIHSDSIYKDTQREVEAKKVDTEQIVAKDAEGNMFAKVVDTVDGGKIILYDETGTKRGELKLDSSGDIRIATEGAHLIHTIGGTDYLDQGGGLNVFKRPIGLYGSYLKEVNWTGFTGRDSAPAGTVGKVTLASPLWDPDGDGNGEIVCYDGTAWQEVVDLPNYT